MHVLHVPAPLTMADHQKILSARPLVHSPTHSFTHSLTHSRKYHDVATTSLSLDASEEFAFSVQNQLVAGFEKPEFVA
jgi:hypothetical protein